MQTNLTRFQELLKSLNNHTSDECLIWSHCMDLGGYGKVWYNDRTVSACRLVFYLTNGYWADPLVRHTCDTRACIHPKHLIGGSHADNAADTIRRGRSNPCRGEAQRSSVLTEAMVREIRQDKEHSHQFFADKFGANRKTIAAVIHGKTWRHVTL